MKRLIVLLVGAALVSSCAPLMLLRTPRPVEAGQIRGGVSFGYGFPLVQAPPCAEDPAQQGSCFSEYIGPSYQPYTAPFEINIAWGAGQGGELDWTIAIGILPGLRVGYKQLLLDGPVLLAADFGGSYYWLNGAIDLGLLASVPLGAWEPYFAARGFYTLPGFVTGALTLGIKVGNDAGFYAELTLGSQGFNSYGRGSTAWRQSVPSVGWILVPAFGIRF